MCRHVLRATDEVNKTCYLLRFLMEDSRHGKDGAAFIESSGEALPLLIELSADLFDLLRRVVTCLRQP